MCELIWQALAGHPTGACRYSFQVRQGAKGGGRRNLLGSPVPCSATIRRPHRDDQALAPQQLGARTATADHCCNCHGRYHSSLSANPPGDLESDSSLLCQQVGLWAGLWTTRRGRGTSLTRKLNIWNPDHLNRIWQNGTYLSDHNIDMYVHVQTVSRH